MLCTAPSPCGVRRELQAVRHRDLGDLIQLLRLNEQHAAIAGVLDRIDLADAPGFEHVGAAGQHAAVEVGLDAAQPEHVVVGMQRAGRCLFDACLDFVERGLSVDAEHDEHAAAQFLFLVKLPVKLDLAVRRVGVVDAGNADGVVVGQEYLESLEAIFLGGLGAARFVFDVLGAVAKNAGRRAGLVAFDAAGFALGNLELRVDTA